MSPTNTIWPDHPAPNAVTAWVETLFSLLDSKDPSAPEKVAALYVEDAVVYGMAGKAVGTEGPLPHLLERTEERELRLIMVRLAIVKARQNSWAHMDSRKHEVLRVYSSKNDFSDLLLIGRLSARFKNGKEVTDDFIVRLVFQGDTGLDPKGSLYQIWAVSEARPMAYAAQLLTVVLLRFRIAHRGSKPFREIDTFSSICSLFWACWSGWKSACKISDETYLDHMGRKQ